MGGDTISHRSRQLFIKTAEGYSTATGNSFTIILFRCYNNSTNSFPRKSIVFSVGVQAQADVTKKFQCRTLRGKKNMTFGSQAKNKRHFSDSMSFVNDLMGQDKRFGNNPEATLIEDNFFFGKRGRSRST